MTLGHMQNHSFMDTNTNLFIAVCFFLPLSFFFFLLCLTLFLCLTVNPSAEGGSHPDPGDMEEGGGVQGDRLNCANK